MMVPLMSIVSFNLTAALSNDVACGVFLRLEGGEVGLSQAASATTAKNTIVLEIMSCLRGAQRRVDTASRLHVTCITSPWLHLLASSRRSARMERAGAE